MNKPEDWYYVPGTLNPADLPSSGCFAQKLLESEWWREPPWFHYPPDEWSRSELSVN